MAGSPVLDVRGLGKSYGGRVLLDRVDFSVSGGEKVGVIGRNGCGKSTLFRILAGLEGSDSGTLALRRGASVAYLAQAPELDPARTVLDVVREGAPHSSSGEWEGTHRAEALLTRLGVGGWDRLVGVLSGGDRRRVALARVLLSEADLLFLDEPTNDLDAETVLWLEEWLFDLRSTILLVTHDRYFLDRVVDRMLEVADGAVVSYDGGYTEYLEARTEREIRERVEGGKRVQFLQKELAWVRRSPPARTGKQKARRRRAADLAAEEGRRGGRGSRLEIDSAAVPRLGSRVIELRGVSKGYGADLLIRDFSDQVLAGERIGIVGPNGVGKTTLLRLLLGTELPDAGEVVLGQTTRVGYFDQERKLDPELGLARVISDSDSVQLGGRSVPLAAYLERFQFSVHEHRRKVSSLSGGERSRLVLARLLIEEVNVLVLDEPTNDLDLEVLGVLEEALDAFSGCLLFVTHDRFFLDRLATSLWVFEADGCVRRHHGSWDAYVLRREEERLAQETRAQETRGRVVRRGAPAGTTPPAGGSPSAAGNQRLTHKERLELEGAEAKIAALEGERDRLAGMLGDPGFYQGDPDEVARVTRRYREAEGEVASLYARWLELGERG
ncbi:MAG: ABC transporter ATP-binding protein [Gemmatimonadetes bacterium]|nr:ABC transporter ATP-binding protein [Gemmatimonadota bacterium]